MQPSKIALAIVADHAMADMSLALSRLADLEWLDERRIASVLQPLRDAGEVAGHRIHGDLHAGQFLRAGETMLLTDFDGNPLQDLDDRSRSQSPLRDVASMVQSIVHVGAVVVKRRRPDWAGEVERFTTAATAAALDEYSLAHLTHDDLLLAFRVAQELHEYAYSIQHLPHWRYVADAALPALLAFR